MNLSVCKYRMKAMSKTASLSTVIRYMPSMLGLVSTENKYLFHMLKLYAVQYFQCKWMEATNIAIKYVIL